MSGFYSPLSRRNQQILRFPSSTGLPYYLSGYLDGLGINPRAALSLRRLISTATVAIRVRRSSDSAEQDIGFIGNVLDTASLLTFVGSNSAFVVKVYDQTGNGEHLEQATSTKQPRIVNAGVYDGKIVFDGTAHAMAITTLTTGAPQVAVYTKLALPGTYTGGFHILYELSADAVGTKGGTFACYFDTATSLWNTNSSGTATRARHYALPLSLMGQVTFLFDTTIVGAAEITARISGSALSASDQLTSEQTGNYRSDQNFNVGARNNGASLFTRMDLDTLVIYNADSSALTSSIEAIVA